MHQLSRENYSRESNPLFTIKTPLPHPERVNSQLDDRVECREEGGWGELKPAEA